MPIKVAVFASLLIPVLLIMDTCQTASGNLADSIAPNHIHKVEGNLRSGELVGTMTVPKLKIMAKLGGYGRFADQLKHSIRVYKVAYITPFQGQDVLASGIIAWPEHVPSDAPLLVAQNGTILADQKAPTSFNPPLRFSGLVLFASAGYITIIPDYIGFGVSSQLTHPYYNFHLTSTSAINMIQAAKEFLHELDIEHGTNMFLFGYSKGGYATMATHKAIESNPDLGLQVTASATGAGSYNLVGVMQHILSQSSFEAPSFLALIVHSYNVINNWRLDPVSFFREPHAAIIPTLLNGHYNKAKIDRKLPNNLDQLFQSEFIEQLREDQIPVLTKALETNSVHHWIPRAPLRIYHSPMDEIIPFSDSEETYRHMRALGACQVELVPIKGDAHSEAVLFMIERVLPWFESLAEGH